MFKVIGEFFGIAFWGTLALAKATLYLVALGAVVIFAFTALWLIAGGPAG